MESSTLESDKPVVSAAQKKIWKQIWKLKTPGKIKHFLWKSCTNSLPIGENLVRRTIFHDPICQLCSNEPESALHALWSSEKVQHVWNTDFGWVDRAKAASGPFTNLVQLVQEKP